MQIIVHIVTLYQNTCIYNVVERGVFLYQFYMIFLMFSCIHRTHPKLNQYDTKHNAVYYIAIFQTVRYIFIRYISSILKLHLYFLIVQLQSLSSLQVLRLSRVIILPQNLRFWFLIQQTVTAILILLTNSCLKIQLAFFL